MWLSDFSSHSATLALRRCVPNTKSDGIAPPDIQSRIVSRIIKLTSRIPIVWFSNFSTGVNTLFGLRAKRRKSWVRALIWNRRDASPPQRDAPSGTAKTWPKSLPRSANAA